MSAPTEAESPALTIQRASRVEGLPEDDELQRAAEAALAGLDAPQVTLRIVDLSEARALNQRWRGRDYASNVLSFPASLPAGVGIHLLGDIAICAEVVMREAAEQGKAVGAHFTHLLVHGILHLRGHDHILQEQAERMEAEEIAILAGLGIDNPYLNDEI